MSHSIDRRHFHLRASLVCGGLLTGALVGEQPLSGQDRDPMDLRLVLLGLNALARAHQRDYFADGHRGASLVAAHLLCVNNHLDEAVRNRIVQLLDLNWASTELCQPFPDSDPVQKPFERISEALTDGVSTLREAGHNAIFAMLAIKAFRILPSAATPQRIDGVCSLIRSFKPWHDVEPDPELNPPPFSDSPAASRFILREALTAIDRFVGFGQGFAGHMLTLGQALVELAAMGDVELAESCRSAFRKYVTVVRRGPEPGAKRYADHQPSKLRPISAEYWRNRGDHAVDIGHVFKYPYSCYDLLRRCDDDELRRAWDEKAYHLF